MIALQCIVILAFKVSNSQYFFQRSSCSWSLLSNYLRNIQTHDVFRCTRIWIGKILPVYSSRNLSSHRISVARISKSSWKWAEIFWQNVGSANKKCVCLREGVLSDPSDKSYPPIHLKVLLGQKRPGKTKVLRYGHFQDE